jgi:hypothetical protein
VVIASGGGTKSRDPPIRGAAECKPFGIAGEKFFSQTAAERAPGGGSLGPERSRDMQRGLQTAVLSVGLATLAACGSSISTDYNPHVGFSQVHTFALVTPPDRASNQLLDDRVRAAVAADLKAKGLTETDRESADVLVGYGIVDRTRHEVSLANWGWGPAWGWRYYRWGVAWPADLSEEVINTYQDGSVVVCMVDAKTHRVIWRSEAEDVVSLPVSDPHLADKDINHAVARIIDKFPPKTNA